MSKRKQLIPFTSRRGYADLAKAIVVTAADDYIKSSGQKDDKEIEKFFNSEWGRKLCFGRNDEILRRLKRKRND